MVAKVELHTGAQPLLAGFRVDEARQKNRFEQHYHAARIREGLDPEDDKDKLLSREQEKEAEKCAEATRLHVEKGERARRSGKYERLASERQLLAQQEAERRRREACRLEREKIIAQQEARRIF
ncbi:hypothetical protein BZA05DRAFT_422691 [Tricharina praecox]|uniref:uncharacterized protein n=1 Tax=Tricharina praecox TaxID=43433 RepID=UPI00222089F3|nr:uncharacterized protein BZA05DRAFT_422691 [Tricharina praecox]KAI5842002.1 hypothetical protein BZA05DRAFT_422691 [Tricharina praecox]